MFVHPLKARLPALNLEYITIHSPCQKQMIDNSLFCFIFGKSRKLFPGNTPYRDLALNCMNEWINGGLGHLCAHIGLTGPGKLPEDGEMNEMALPSRHRILNLSPDGLWPSTLSLGHGGSPQYWIFTSERRRNFCFSGTWRPECGTNPRSQIFQLSALTTAPLGWNPKDRMNACHAFVGKYNFALWSPIMLLKFGQICKHLKKLLLQYYIK